MQAEQEKKAREERSRASTAIAGRPAKAKPKGLSAQVQQGWEYCKAHQAQIALGGVSSLLVVCVAAYVVS